MVSCPIVFATVKHAIVFSTEFKPQVRAKDRGVDKCIRTAWTPCFEWSKWPWSKCIMLCRLYNWTKSRFMIRNHFTAAVSGLIVSDVNLNFSCFVHNVQRILFSASLVSLCFCIIRTLFECVLSNFGLQDTLSYQVLKKCATLTVWHRPVQNNWPWCFRW